MQLPPDFSVGYGSEVEDTDWSVVGLVFGLLVLVLVGVYFLMRRAGEREK